MAIAYSVSPMATPEDLAKLLELRTAERDIALTVLDRLEAVVARIGGHMTADDQRALGDARAVLEVHGHRKSKPRPEWRNRG